MSKRSEQELTILLSHCVITSSRTLESCCSAHRIPSSLTGMVEKFSLSCEVMVFSKLGVWLTRSDFVVSSPYAEYPVRMLRFCNTYYRLSALQVGLMTEISEDLWISDMNFIKIITNSNMCIVVASCAIECVQNYRMHVHDLM